jgi:hypothetical protein
VLRVSHRVILGRLPLDAGARKCREARQRRARVAGRGMLASEIAGFKPLGGSCVIEAVCVVVFAATLSYFVIRPYARSYIAFRRKGSVDAGRPAFERGISARSACSPLLVCYARWSFFRLGNRHEAIRRPGLDSRHGVTLSSASRWYYYSWKCADAYVTRISNHRLALGRRLNQVAAYSSRQLAAPIQVQRGRLPLAAGQPWRRLIGLETVAVVGHRRQRPTRYKLWPCRLTILCLSSEPVLVVTSGTTASPCR